MQFFWSLQKSLLARTFPSLRPGGSGFFGLVPGANIANVKDMRILVADDDRVVSTLVCALVRKKGWQAIAAFDANQAFMVAMQNPPPDAIILDIGMPGGTGF